MSFPHTIADGRYTLVEPLRVGGMATVFKARDQRLRVWRAIKILSPQYSNRPSLKDRFEAEARTTALLEHRHIVKVYDVGRSNGQPFIVMELVRGGNLVDWVKEHGFMPPRMAAEVTIQICAGVGAAHAKKVVHRDIKPHNVLITSDGTCLITDFGIARVGDDTDGLTRTGAVFGTWAYMAPEQRADAKKVDSRADVYSLGATLYFLLTARTPVDLFAAEKDETVMEDIHEGLRPILVKATQYKRSDRFSDVHEFSAALAEVLDALPDDPEGTPALAREVAPPEQLRGGARAVPNGAGGVTLLPPEGAPGELGGGTLVPGPADSGKSFNLADFAAAGIIQPMVESGGEEGANNYLPLVTDLPPANPDGQPVEGEDEFFAAPVPPSQVVVSRGLLVAIALALFSMFLLVGIQIMRDRGGPEIPPEEVTPAELTPLPPEQPVETPPEDPPEDPPEEPPPEEPPGETGKPAGPVVKVDPPPVPKGPVKASVAVSGEADEVRFLSNGESVPAGTLSPGTYQIRAKFGDGAPVPAGQITLREGEKAEVFCSADFLQCTRK